MKEEIGMFFINFGVLIQSSEISFIHFSEFIQFSLIKISVFFLSRNRLETK